MACSKKKGKKHLTPSNNLMVPKEVSEPLVRWIEAKFKKTIG
jgi:hypothetical protein